MTRNSINSDRSTGGPGSSQHNTDQERQDPNRAGTDPRAPDKPTNPERSRVSGGGGERDQHHTHDPRTKA